jgi:hypothetical protein
MKRKKKNPDRMYADAECVNGFIISEIMRKLGLEIWV